MKVLHVINIGGIGGAEKLIPSLLNSFTSVGVDADCLIIHHMGCNDSANYIRNKLMEYKISVFLMQRKNTIDIFKLILLRNFIIKRRYSLIHSHLRHADLWLFILKFFRLISIPIVTTIHGYRDSFQNNHGLDSSKISIFSAYFWLVRLVLKRFDHIIFISKCLQEFYHTARLVTSTKSSVIYNGYNIFSFKKKLRSHTRNDIIHIALPGRLIKMKGHRYALEALKCLLAEYPLSILHILGTGPEESKIRKIVYQLELDKNVVIHGYVENVGSIYAISDIVLIPSLGEAFGMVFLESFAYKVPVVAFDLPSGNEIINSGFNGLLSSPRDSADMYKKIKSLLTDTALYQKIVTNAHENLLHNYSIFNMGISYKKIYSDLVLNT
jgi:glycosyltransferase involved in cell wall biosynthesis